MATRETPWLTIVLHEPEIPNNTGAIGRTCVATGAAMRLIEPIAFDTSEKACRRAGLDYWPRLAPTTHASWTEYLAKAQPPRLWLYTTKSTRPHWEADFRPGDHLVFGKETAGLPDDILRDHEGRTVTLPMIEGERSLNLANAACAALYEAMRQIVSQTGARVDNKGHFTT
jgi:tRNA (cytidine/uridine-2'-O-)-methyltransferase